MIFVLAVIVALVALITWRAASKKVSDNPGFRSTANLSGAAAAFFTVVAILQLFTQVPAGHVGVVGFFGLRPRSPGRNQPGQSSGEGTK